MTPFPSVEGACNLAARRREHAQTAPLLIMKALETRTPPSRNSSATHQVRVVADSHELDLVLELLDVVVLVDRHLLDRHPRPPRLCVAVFRLRGTAE
eukprot:3813682-Rhodomonas_salina.1